MCIRTLDDFISAAENDDELNRAVKKIASKLHDYGSILERDGKKAVEILARDQIARADEAEREQLKQHYQKFLHYVELVDKLSVRPSIRGFVIKKLEAIVDHPNLMTQGGDN